LTRAYRDGDADRVGQPRLFNIIDRRRSLSTFLAPLR